MHPLLRMGRPWDNHVSSTDATYGVPLVLELCRRPAALHNVATLHGVLGPHIVRESINHVSSTGRVWRDVAPHARDAAMDGLLSQEGMLSLVAA